MTPKMDLVIALLVLVVGGIPVWLALERLAIRNDVHRRGGALRHLSMRLRNGPREWNVLFRDSDGLSCRGICVVHLKFGERVYWRVIEPITSTSAL